MLDNRSAVERIADSHHGGGGVGIQHNLAMNGSTDSQWLWWLIMGFGMLIRVLFYMSIGNHIKGFIAEYIDEEKMRRNASTNRTV